MDSRRRPVNAPDDGDPAPSGEAAQDAPSSNGGRVLDGRVLVLNRSWLAVHVTQAKRALCLLYQGHARAVHPTEYSLHDMDEWIDLWEGQNHGRYIHTPHLRIRVPDVILLTLFNGFVRHEVRFSRHSVFERDNNTCQYCGKRFNRSKLTIDHVVPQSRGGDDSWGNLVVACLSCNVEKANRTPEEAGMPLLRKPKQPSWMPALSRRVPTDQMAVWARFVDTSFWHAGVRS